MLLVDVGEVVGQEDSVLLVITTAKVEEFLTRREQLGDAAAKHVEVVDERHHRYKSGDLLNRVLVARIRLQVDNLSRRFLGRQESAQQDTCSCNVLAEQLDVFVLKLALGDQLMEPLCSVIKHFLFFVPRIRVLVHLSL